jgi:hypothetical protein
MANETTTTTLDDLTHTSLIEPYLINALSEQAGLYRVCKEFDARGKSTAALKIPSETSWWGSANDDGAGVDLEFNATDVTDLSNTAVSTGGITITAAEYGVAIEVSDRVEEDSIDGLDMLMKIEQRMLHVLNLALEDDFLALLASLSQVTGTSGSDLTAAQLLSAITNLRVRGVLADSLVGILDNQQATDAQTAFITTNAAAAVFAFAADRILNYVPTSDRGMGPTRQVATFAGVPMFATGLTDTANAGADVVGGIVTPSTAYNDNTGHVTFGMAWKRLPTFETERHAKKRTTDLVMTCRWGVAEMLDGSGEGIVTDA